MTIDLHIDSITISGLSLAPADAAHLREQIVTHLTELIETGGIDRTFAGAADDHIRTPRPLVLTDTRAATLGPQIASAIYGQLGPRSGTRR